MMVVFTIAIAALYALPNIYGEDPAIQITGARGASVNMSTLDSVTQALDQKSLSYKSIALEVAKRNINVNIVSPGFISTSMTDKLTDDQKKIYLNKIPMSRFGSSEDVANLVYFLSTKDSSYITGQNLHVNGGMLMV